MTTTTTPPVRPAAGVRPASPSGPLRAGRMLWRRLVSMRTALVLLFLLALASVPGSLLPQENANPDKVATYIATHGRWGSFLKSIQMFHVFSSYWFTAIYLLLFISLIGCLIPRISVYAKAVRSAPIKAPRNLGRLAENDEFAAAATPEALADQARATLRPRWRVAIRHEDSGAIALSAEKGYLREAGNLIFHVSLLIALVLFALGRLYKYQGTSVVTEGSSFSNPGPYDAFSKGAWVQQSTMSTFRIQLNEFSAQYASDGQPLQYSADISYALGTGAALDRHDVVRVNHPLRIAGDRVYLLNHGFAPEISIQRPGKKAIVQVNNFIPEDSFYTSDGQFSDDNGTTGIGISGVFAPSAVNNNGVITSLSPSMDNPVLAVNVYEGDLGKPTSVYSLDARQIANGKLRQVGSANLAVGGTPLTLKDGTVIRLLSVKQWATIQVSHDPTQDYLLVVAILMVGGLLASLVIRRRRLWLRFVPDSTSDGTGPPRTLVGVGGLARSDTGNFSGEFASLVVSLRGALQGEDIGVPGASGAAVGVREDST